MINLSNDHDDLPKLFLMDDIDANYFVHWLVYNIPPFVESLPSPQATEGVNTRNLIGYTPPCPPEGKHRYRFRVFTLKRNAPKLPPDLTASQVFSMLEPFILQVEQSFATLQAPKQRRN